MLAFIYFAYQMMALLYENVPVSKHTWTNVVFNVSSLVILIPQTLPEHYTSKR
jgi:hypothetical protein